MLAGSAAIIASSAMSVDDMARIAPRQYVYPHVMLSQKNCFRERDNKQVKKRT